MTDQETLIPSDLPTVICRTLRQIDREHRRIVVGTADLPGETDRLLERLQAGMPIQVVTDVRGGETWVVAIERDG